MTHGNLSSFPQRNAALNKAPVKRQRQRGFSLFEMIIYILAASILFSAAFNRYREFPGEAERANFLAITAQLNAAINLQMMNAIAGGNFNQLNGFNGVNPMDFMLSTPGNYVGAFGTIDESALPRRIWYFNQTTGELVYLANDASNLYLVQGGQRVPTGRISFRVQNVVMPRADGSSAWQGLLLAPVVPFEWQQVSLVAAVTAQ